jgi:hypothetical protein
MNEIIERIEWWKELRKAVATAEAELTAEAAEKEMQRRQSSGQCKRSERVLGIISERIDVRGLEAWLRSPIVAQLKQLQQRLAVDCERYDLDSTPLLIHPMQADSFDLQRLMAQLEAAVLRQSVEDQVGDSWYSCADLAKRHGVSQSRLYARLRRHRQSHIVSENADWQETESVAVNKPKFLYRESDEISEILADLQRG